MLNNKENDARTCWELCKIEIKEKSVSFGKNKAKSIKSKISHLEKEFKEKTDQNADQEEIQNIEKELEEEYSKKAVGAKIRSRIKWIEEGEKHTKYFLSLEKNRQVQKSITKLYDKEGKTITTQADILNRQK